MKALSYAYFVVFLSLVPTLSGSQTLPWSDNFAYTATNALTAESANWVLNTSGTNTVKISSGGLSYPNYASSGVGNAIDLKPEQESVFRRFSVQTPPIAIYVSFLVKVSSAPASPTQDFLHFADTTSVSEYPDFAWGRVYVKDNGSGMWQYGISKAGGDTPQYTATTYDSSATQLIVVKYSMVSGFSNDTLKLWVNPDLSGTEPPADVTIFPSTSDPVHLRMVELSGLASSNTPTLVLDGIRVGTSWSDAPLPVQLTSLNAFALRGAAEIRWSTATEVQNYGFEIERRGLSQIPTDARGYDSRNESNNPRLNDVGQASIQLSNWRSVGFVQGSGTSTSPREYSFLDRNLPPGRYAYRIKQIDLDGSFTYSLSTEVEIGAAPKLFTLSPNYPNPFNPSTNIEFTLPENGFVSLKVYNMLGQEVARLFEGEAIAGKIYQRSFEASSLPTGVYVSRLTFGNQNLMQKMILAK